MPHFSNRNGLNFHSKSPFDLQSINSCISFLKYNLISNYVQREILYSHHSHLPKVWKSLSHYWKTSLECGISSTKRESFTEGQDHSESFQSPGLLLAFSVSSLYQVSEKKQTWRKLCEFSGRHFWSYWILTCATVSLLLRNWIVFLIHSFM